MKSDMRSILTFVFFAFRYHPNLAVYVNGKKTKKYLAQAGNIAIKIPKGSSQVTIQYTHAWYDVLGKWITFVTILLLGLYLVGHFYIKVRKQKKVL